MRGRTRCFLECRGRRPHTRAISTPGATASIPYSRAIRGCTARGANFHLIYHHQKVAEKAITTKTHRNNCVVFVFSYRTVVYVHWWRSRTPMFAASCVTTAWSSYKDVRATSIAKNGRRGWYGDFFFFFGPIARSGILGMGCFCTAWEKRPAVEPLCGSPLGRTGPLGLGQVASHGTEHSPRFRLFGYPFLPRTFFFSFVLISRTNTEAWFCSGGKKIAGGHGWLIYRFWG